MGLLEFKMGEHVCEVSRLLKLAYLGASPEVEHIRDKMFHLSTTLDVVKSNFDDACRPREVSRLLELPSRGRLPTNRTHM